VLECAQAGTQRCRSRPIDQILELEEEEKKKKKKKTKLLVGHM
jgi:hypothetical protein